MIRTYPLGTLLDAVALNAAAASRTFEFGPTVGSEDLRNYPTFVMEVEYTYANDGALLFTFTNSIEAGSSPTADHILTTGSLAGGIYTIYESGYVYTDTLTSSKKFNHVLGIAGSTKLKCVVSHQGTPAAGDIITVRGCILSVAL